MKLTSIPANSSPIHHDSVSMGINVADRYTVMYCESKDDNLVIVDTMTGKRVKLTFPKPEVKLVKPKRSQPSTESWVDLNV